MKRLSIMSVFALIVCTLLFTAAPANAGGCGQSGVRVLTINDGCYQQPANVLLFQQQRVLDANFTGAANINNININAGRRFRRGDDIDIQQISGGGGANINNLSINGRRRR